MRYIILLLLYGCSSIPTEELENQLMACFNAHKDCELISAELQRRERAKERRLERENECSANTKCYQFINGKLVRMY